jgi:hypothetical protein
LAPQFGHVIIAIVGCSRPPRGAAKSALPATGGGLRIASWTTSDAGRPRTSMTRTRA